MMTPLHLFFYGVAIAGSLFLILSVCAIFVGMWLYLLGSTKGRE